MWVTIGVAVLLGTVVAGNGVGIGVAEGGGAGVVIATVGTGVLLTAGVAGAVEDAVALPVGPGVTDGCGVDVTLVAVGVVPLTFVGTGSTSGGVERGGFGGTRLAGGFGTELMGAFVGLGVAEAVGLPVTVGISVALALVVGLEVAVTLGRTVSALTSAKLSGLAVNITFHTGVMVEVEMADWADRTHVAPTAKPTMPTPSTITDPAAINADRSHGLTAFGGKPPLMAASNARAKSPADLGRFPGSFSSARITTSPTPRGTAGLTSLTCFGLTSMCMRAMAISLSASNGCRPARA